MTSVPQYGREVNPQNTPMPYKSADTTGAFGQDIYKAQANFGKALGDVEKSLDEIQTRIENTNLVEFANRSSEWEQANLYDKERGYLYKTGKDAYGQSQNILSDYDKYMNEQISKVRLRPEAKARAMHLVSNCRSRINQTVTAHDFKQGIEWSKAEGDSAKFNYVNNAVNMRNNPEEISKAIMSGFQVIEWQGEMQHKDPSQIKLDKQNYLSELHQNVLNAYISDGSLRAREYFEENKSHIAPEKLAQLESAIDKMETKYNSNLYSTQILSQAKSEEEALAMADNIEDEDTRDLVRNKISSKFSTDRRLHDLNQKELSKQFNSTVLSKSKSGEALSYDDIPEGLDPDTELSFRLYVDKANKNEDVETDNQLYEELLDMRYNNAQAFLDTDLYKYRGFLKESDFRHFLTEQEKLKQSDYHTQFKEKDLKEKIENAIDTSGLKWTHGKTQNVWISETKALVRELELRRGRKATDSEIDNIIKSLGYKDEKGVYLYKKYEEGMSKRTGFLRDVINDISYYQNKHNGNFPEENELSKIINNRVLQEAQKEQTKAQNIIQNITARSNYWKNIDSVQPKVNEQKVTTYFADYEIPEMSKRLGFDVRVTSRYRSGAGSHHGEGRAVDIGMAKETRAQRIQIYEELVKLPYVKAIGTSDPNILAHFNGNKKIIDEREYDKKNKTNHVNHAHVTFFWDREIAGKQPKSTNIAVKNGVYSL